MVGGLQREDVRPFACRIGIRQILVHAQFVTAERCPAIVVDRPIGGTDLGTLFVLVGHAVVAGIRGS